MAEPPHQMERVSADTHPVLYNAFNLIRLDHGGSHSHEWYAVPGATAEQLRRAEAALAALSKEDLDTMSCGEASEVEAIAARGEELAAANKLLNDFFDDGTDCCDQEPSNALTGE